MIYVGLDDTDTLDDPGTNQLARHLVRELAGDFNGRMILRHQLLEDPRVPCTKKNGCASILLEPVDVVGCVEASETHQLQDFIERLRAIIVPWCPKGSDPGLCVAESVPPAIAEWGRRCQRELVTQAEARNLAAEHSIHLEGLGGTNDGIIGALAAIGLMSTRNDGRVVYFGPGGEDWYDVTGVLTVNDILARGVQEIRKPDGGLLTEGTVEIGKRLRPNFRDGKVVLFVAPREDSSWEAVRVT